MPASHPHSEPAPIGSGPQQRPALHPDVQPLADHLLTTARLSIEKAIAHQAAPKEYATPAPGSLEGAMLQALRVRPAASQQAAIASVLPRVRADAATRAKHYGPLSRVDLRAATPVAEQARALMPALNLDRVIPSAPAPKGASKKPTFHFEPFKRLELRLLRVVCKDETNGLFGSEAGDDEIGLGVIRIDPSGQNTNLGTFTVGNSFDDGDTVAYNPPRVIASWRYDLDNHVAPGDVPVLHKGKQVPVGWPRTYGAILLLSELDNGGFPSTVAMICNHIRSWLVQEVGKAVAKWLGGYLGGPMGAAIGEVVGKVVGSIVDWVLAKFINILIEVWNDDMFPTVMATITRPNKFVDFKGNLLGPATTSSPGWFWVAAHGGRYEMHFDWHIVK